MIVRSTFFKLVVGGILIFGIFVVTLNLISYRQNRNSFDFIGDSNAYIISDHDDHESVRVKADVKSSSKPALLSTGDGKIDIPNVHVRTYSIVMNNEQDQNVLVRGAGEGNFHILLLHGQAFTSETWQKIGTLQYLASWGYNAFAIDLPGYGNSSLPVIQETAAAAWLARLIHALRLSNFVIVSPSMSGRFSLPFVFQSNPKHQSLRGFIPIAPVGTKKLNTKDYEQTRIPTLIVYGENDTDFKYAVNVLKQIPTSEILTIKNASHACYVQRPMEFHNGLRQFLYAVYRPIYVEQNKKGPSSSVHTSPLATTSLKLDNHTRSKMKRAFEYSTVDKKHQQHVH